MRIGILGSGLMGAKLELPGMYLAHQSHRHFAITRRHGLCVQPMN